MAYHIPRYMRLPCLGHEMDEISSQMKIMKAVVSWVSPSKGGSLFPSKLGTLWFFPTWRTGKSPSLIAK